MYQALYRKYRPQTFEEVIGQDHITKTLSNMVKNGQISHAYLFTGSRGTGKTSVARIFARAINCETPVNGSACGKCKTCKALLQENNMDILEIDAASNNRVDEIRELREKIKFSPVNSKYKVYIIDEVHMLTDSAFNALLKTLEEPPAHAVFILGTTEVHKLPATILSRCLRFDFHLVSNVELSAHLRYILSKENIEFDEKAISSIVSAAEGGVRDMLSIADSVISFNNGKLTAETVSKVLLTAEFSQVSAFVQGILKKYYSTCFETLESIVSNGKSPVVFSKDVTVYFRNLLVCKTCKNANDILKLSQENFTEMENQASLASEDELIFSMKTFSGIEAELKYSLSPKTLVEVATLTAISGEGVKKN